MATITTTAYGNTTIPVLDPNATPDPVNKTSMGGTPDEIRTNFIRLLVAQMENQDPLNPSSSTDMTSQLAQIQSLESQEQMNTKMDSLIGAITAGQSYGLMSAIGRYAKVESSEVTLDSAGASASVVADANYPSVQVTMTDSAGKVVATNTFNNVTTGDLEFTWGGVDLSGAKVAAGQYGISAVGISTNGTRVPLKVDPLIKVDAVINELGVWKLKLANGKSFAQADLKGIY